MVKYTKRVYGFKTFVVMQEYIKRNKIKNVLGYGYHKKQKHFFEYK